ncbi:hypothetical protein N7470_009802 [Penicillium chermesinum]|nr:hypothetical protein N7470_009802 [Penicillium chermesinum]
MHRAVSRPSGLSAAEQAIRDALVAKTPPKPEPTSEVESENKLASGQKAEAGAALDHQPRQDSDPFSGPTGDNPAAKVTSRWGWGNRQGGKPSGLSAAEQAMRDSIVARSTPTPFPGLGVKRETPGPSDRIPGTPARSTPVNPERKASQRQRSKPDVRRTPGGFNLIGTERP